VKKSCEKILLISDNPHYQQYLKNNCYQWQAHCKTVKNEIEAREVLMQASQKGNLFKFVLVDSSQFNERLSDAIRDIKLNSKQSNIFVLTKPEEECKFDEICCISKPLESLQLYNAMVTSIGKEQDLIHNVADTENEVSDLLESPPQFNAQVLLSEDDPTNQIVAEGILCEFGIKIDIVADGQQAVEAIQNKTYDLIFMDCQMPVLDGYQATKKIRKLENLKMVKHLPIVALTANNMQGDKDICLAAGMDDFLAKPIEPADFFRILKKWLPHKKVKIVSEA